jgi:hypothetical protein
MLNACFMARLNHVLMEAVLGPISVSGDARTGKKDPKIGEIL